MAEVIVDGAGSGFFASVNSEGRLLVDISGATINIGSVSASVDSVYVQSGLISIVDSNQSPICHPLGSEHSDSDHALDVHAVLSAKNPTTGSYINIDSTAGGNLKVSVEDWNGVTGSVYNVETVPTSAINNNPLLNLVYISSGTSTGLTGGSAIGSIVQFIGPGSFVKVLAYSNNNLTNVGSWT